MHQFTVIKKPLFVTFGTLLLASLLISHPSHAETAPNSERFRIGPTLEEAERAERGEPVTPPADAAIGFSQQDWNKVRENVEEGVEPGSTVVPVAESSAPAKVPPKPAPGLLQVELPYESSLSVTGRKVIKLDLENTHISRERANELGTKQDTQNFNMEQELQARIQGTVARKTTINVNFDDTKENVRDFSVVYKGDPDEVVQEAAFGDIVLSLPSTEFVNYNKQLFGIRTALKYKKLGFLAIGSRTKGTTETKRFTGTTTRQQVFINDTAYVRRKFYDLQFNVAGTTTAMRDPGNPYDPGLGRVIVPINGTIPEEVYIEDNTTNPQAQLLNIAYATAPLTTTVQIRMRQMSPGVDFSVDRLRGILTFTNPVPEDARIAVDYTIASGQRIQSLVAGGVAILIKDKNPEPQPVSQEIKRFYSAGSKNVVRDNGLGNFQLRVLDKNRENQIGDTLVPVQRYPDTIDMRFETGIFELRTILPFPDVYATTVNQGSPLQAVFSLEYQSILRTYTLRPNIVLQSETVEVDGRKVSRDIDYFIDYDIGIITFFNEDLIRESTVIEVTYEFAPFGGTLGETLVGARATYDIVTNKTEGGVKMESWAAGSTVLYNFAAKPSGPPDVRSTPASLLVTEGDSQVKGLRFGDIPVTTNLGFEAARSAENPNLFGKAIIDSMEGIKQDDAVTLIKDVWQPASNPNSAPFNTSNRVSDFRGRENLDSHLRWADTDVQTTDPSDENATQKALELVYELNTESASTQEQLSLVTTLSQSGRDFSKKTTLEVELEVPSSEGAGVEFLVEFGSFNEDADGDGFLDTEDTIPFDNTLNLGEDNGYTFDGPGPNLTTGDGDDTNVLIGDDNARLDTEDLNNDRVLSSQDLPVFINQPIFYLSGTTPQTDSTGATFTDLNFGATSRRLFQIPIDTNALTDEEKARLTAVRQVRVTLRNNNAGTPRTGRVRITRISMVGNTYEPATISTPTFTSTMTVRAVNNKDDGSFYTSLFGDPTYADLYGSAVPADDAKEQALALDYRLSSGSFATTRNAYSAPRDFSKHDILRFFLRKPVNLPGKTSGGAFFFDAGSETEFQRAAIAVDDIPDDRWLLVVLKQADVNGDGTPDTWESQTPGVTISRTGNAPNLTQVAQIRLGVQNNIGSEIRHQIWVNEIHVSQPHERTGHAKRYSFDSSWAQWMDFGGNFRDVDRNWQTPTTSITNQDRTQQDAYVNFNRLTFLPMTYKTTRDRTVTPSAFRSNTNALVSFLDEGRVDHVNNLSTAKLIIPKLPVVDFSYNNDRTENTITQRRESADTVSVGATYAPNSRFDLLPGRGFSFRPIPTSMTLLYSHRTTKLRFPGLERLNTFNISTSPFSSTNITQFRDEREARMAFRPWEGFTFNPTYKLTHQTERRDFRTDELASQPRVGAIDGRVTPRSLSQTVAASGNLKLLKWLDPRYSYSVTGTETNNLPTLSNTTAYTLKNITRNSDGEVSAAIQVNQVLKRTKLLNSMNLNTSYRIESGDTYNDMPEGFRWRSKLWLGDPLALSTTSLSGSTAIRANSTDRRTFRENVAWHPLSAYSLEGPRVRPLKSLSITSNYLISTENSETTGTTRRTKSTTFPDLVLTMSDIEDIFGIKRVIDSSRLVFRDNLRKTETFSVSRTLAQSYGGDYQFQFYKRLDVSTTFNLNNQREDNLVTNQLTSKTDTVNYSIQARIPFKAWAYTPRYEFSNTETRDSVRLTNDLRNDILSLQIYGDVSKPLGIRFGRREIGLANRVIINSTIKWDKKRSSVNPSTNYLDTYSAAGTADYTISQNFRLAVGGSFAQEKHHPDFKKLDKFTFGLQSTLTIQF